MNQIINQEIIKQIQPNYNDIPLAIFLLGTNGSGKSSLRNYLNLSNIQTNIDPDVLNRIYAIRYPHTYQIESARQALKMYDNALFNSLNICLESTLSGRGTIQRIIKAQEMGYFTIAYYIGLNSIELNLERIKIRAASGGHNIAESVVRRRYYESVNNLIFIKNHFNLLHILDNSDQYFRLQYSISLHNTVKHCQTPETWANKLMQQL
ncbi:MAG: hypothetical protein QG673_1267 [Pseudomonadota bacterium]|nr:hypothetical protein [Pseudomonadota bacterium]